MRLPDHRRRADGPEVTGASWLLRDQLASRELGHLQDAHFLRHDDFPGSYGVIEELLILE